MKPSFKTTTIIAAISMTIAVGLYLVMHFMNTVLGIDLYVHPVRMNGLWRVYYCFWWFSVIVFFWGMFRFPDQLPKRDKWSKAIGITMLVIVVLMFYDRLYVGKWSDAQWVRCLIFAVRSIIRCVYLAALWWCYAKSDNESTPNIMRYTALIAVMLGLIALLLTISNAIGWWFSSERFWIYAPMRDINFLHTATYACIAVCVSLGLYDKKTMIQQ